MPDSDADLGATLPTRFKASTIAFEYSDFSAFASAWPPTVSSPRRRSIVVVELDENAIAPAATSSEANRNARSGSSMTTA